MRHFQGDSMKRLLLTLGATLSLVIVSVSGQAPPAVRPGNATPPAAVAPGVRPVVDKFCVSCHNDRSRTGELSLQ